MQNEKEMTFATSTQKRIRLVVADKGRKREYSLFHGEKMISGVQSKALEVLEYLADRSGRPCHRNDILDTVSTDSDLNLIDRYICDLRNKFREAAPECSQIIKTHFGKGYYELLLPVEITGDLDSIKAYSVWDRQRFFDLLKHVKRGTGPDGDIRISTTGLGPGIEMINFSELLRNKLRIKVLYTNPNNQPLIDSRFILRSERPNAYKRCLSEHAEQVDDFLRLASDYPPMERDDARPAPSGPGRGELEFHLSDGMPCGFVVHTLKWAAVGIFLAHTSYTFGPMLEIESRSPAWQELMLDWRARWDHATNNEPKLYKRN